MADNDLRITLTADATGVVRAVAQAKSALGGLAPSVQSLARAFSDVTDKASRGFKSLVEAANSLAKAAGAGSDGRADAAKAGGGVTSAADAGPVQPSAITDGATLGADQPAQAQQTALAADLAATKTALDAKVAATKAAVAQMTAAYAQGDAEQDGDRQQELDRFRSDWARTVDPVVSSFTHGLVQMAEGTRTFGEVLKGLGHQILDDFINNVVDKKIEAWLWSETVQTSQTAAGAATRSAVENTNFFTRLLALLGVSVGAHSGAEAAKTAATTAGATLRTTISATGAATAQGVEGAIAGKSIIADAAKAAAGAYQAIVGIPIVGPILAPAAAASAFAAVAAFQGLLSAEGGFDVPFGVNPITQLHAREMVLPAHLADRVRALSANEPRAGDTTTFNYTAHAYGRDADDLERVLARHGQRLQRFIQNAARNNVRLGVRRA
jgi:hypothetical protein